MSTAYKTTNFIHDIVKYNIIQFNKIELSCGRTSSYYADFRQLLEHPPLVDYTVSQIIKIIDALVVGGTTYNKIAGVAVAGVPWATLVGNKLNKPVSIVRLSEKTHGKKSSIDGAPIQLDDNVILIEDVLTTGKSVINAIRKIHNTGATVTRVICILDRNEGAQEHIKYYFPDVKVSSILSIDTIVSVCSTNKLITDYIEEQISFYREASYTETIKMLTRLNDDAKEKEYQKDPVKWHMSNYSDVWNFKTGQSEINSLFVDVSNMTDWSEIKYKLNKIGPNVHNLVVKFENICNWNEEKQEELYELHKKYGFNIIYKSAECIAESSFVNLSDYTLFNTLKTIYPGCKYPNYVLTNGLILNLYIDKYMQHNELILQLQEAIKKYELCKTFSQLKINNIYINLIGSGVNDIISNLEFWQEFRNYILNIINNQILQIKGLIIPYTYIKKCPNILNKKLAISKLVPLILDISYNSEFYLEQSMLTDNVNTDYVESALTLTKTFNGNNFTHLMVGNDLLQSNLIVETKFLQYIDFVKYLAKQTQNKAFTFLQISEALTTPFENNTIVTKVNLFIKQNDSPIKNIDLSAQTVSQSSVSKYMTYLITGTNKILNLFGIALVPITINKIN